MLEAVNLGKSYGKVIALHKVGFRVEAGEILCLVGGNGAGKTTTLDVFMGFTTPTEGEARVHGKTVTPGNTDTLARLAYIPENVTLYGEMTALENLEFFSALAGKKADRKRLADLLSRAGLASDAHNRNVGGFSKGMRQKTGLAVALAKEAEVLLLDEPMSGLDPLAAEEFSDLLASLAHDGIAILMATHDLFLAWEIATHIGIMKNGRLLEILTAADISHESLQKKYLQLAREPSTAAN